VDLDAACVAGDEVAGAGGTVASDRSAAAGVAVVLVAAVVLAGVEGSAAALGGLAADEAAAAVVAVGGKTNWKGSLMQMTRSTAMRMLILVVALLPLTGCSYNKFVGQEEAIKAQWAQVENQLQRRNDLIPNLVETVKGYAQHEESVYKDIADARSRLLAAKSPEETIQAANQQTSALGRLLAVVENYPQLRANEQFNRLMDELSGTENRIATERMRYNEKVQEYNTSRRQFPANVTARVFGFKEYPFFDAPPAAEQVPKVNFSK
jgi:LemA protein